MDTQKFKTILLPYLYDSKGRYNSPQLSRLKSFKKINDELFLFLEEQLKNGIGISESIYGIFNEKRNYCIICGKPTKYQSFYIGYKKTCHSEECLKKSYGLNPHTPSIQERQQNSKRMMKNNPMYNKETARKAHSAAKNKNNGILPIHNPVSKLKALESRYDKYQCFSPKNNLFKTKDYVFPSGKTIKIQGYEGLALDILLTTYSEQDIEICGRNHSFIYKKKNNDHRYYPDLFIKPINTYIEVKSFYTYKKNINMNLLKRQAILDAGYDFRFMIVKNHTNKKHYT